MKTGKYILTLIVLLSSFIIVNAQHEDLNRRLQRTQTQINRLERTVSHIQNMEIKVLYTEAQNLFNQAKQYYLGGYYFKSQSFLTLTNGKLLQILQILKSNPIFKRKFLIKLEKTLRRAENKIRTGNNQQAIYFLDQAYSFKKQGLNLLQASNGQLINAIELLFMAEKFAQRSIEVSSNINYSNITDNDFENRFTTLKNDIQQIKRTNIRKISRQKLTEVEKQLWLAKKLYNRGNTIHAYHLLKQVENKIGRFIGERHFKMSASKLFRQFQIQKQTVETFNELALENQVMNKLLDRIHDNLEMIKVKFNEEAFFQCEKLLKTNYQLIRTLKRMLNNQNDDVSDNLIKKINQLEKQLLKLEENGELSSKNMENLRLSEYFLQKAKTQLEQKHPLLSAVCLRTAYKFNELIANKETDAAPVSKQTLKIELEKILPKIEQLPENNNKKLLKELTDSIENNLQNGNLKAAEILLNITIESLNRKINKK